MQSLWLKNSKINIKLKVYKENFNSLRRAAVKDVKNSIWDGKNALDLDNPLFKIESMTFYQNDFIDYILLNQKTIIILIIYI